ncbi:MAG TPA: hypothetical protein VN203_26550, partial [Candidatus Acidoferrum sp.]|nr:hypothetical protein [Candidatus Acidoferrum sp.]
EDLDRVVVSQLGDVKGDSPSVMIRRHQWKLVVHTGYEQPQLFNLANDPEEKNDLAQDPRCAAVLGQLLGEIRKYWDEQAVLKILDESAKHDKIMRAWVKATKTDFIERWEGDRSNNYLL